MGAKSRNGEVAEKAGKGQMGGMDTPPPGATGTSLCGASPHKTEARKKKKRWDDKTLLVDSLKTYFPR